MKPFSLFIVTTALVASQGVQATQNPYTYASAGIDLVMHGWAVQGCAFADVCNYGGPFAGVGATDYTDPTDPTDIFGNDELSAVSPSITIASNDYPPFPPLFRTFSTYASSYVSLDNSYMQVWGSNQQSALIPGPYDYRNYYSVKDYSAYSQARNSGTSEFSISPDLDGQDVYLRFNYGLFGYTSGELGPDQTNTKDQTQLAFAARFESNAGTGAVIDQELYAGHIDEKGYIDIHLRSAASDARQVALNFEFGIRGSTGVAWGGAKGYSAQLKYSWDNSLLGNYALVEGAAFSEHLYDGHDLPGSALYIQNGVFDSGVAFWSFDGNGQFDIVESPYEVGEKLARMEILNNESSDTPLVSTTRTNTPDSPFFLTFEYAFLTETGRLEVWLDGSLLDTVLATPIDGAVPDLSLHQIQVSEGSLLGLEFSPLEFKLFPGSPAAVVFDNVGISPVPEPQTWIDMVAGIALIASLRRCMRKRQRWNSIYLQSVGPQEIRGNI